VCIAIFSVNNSFMFADYRRTIFGLTQVINVVFVILCTLVIASN